jgi:two-component system cell cycle response regulator DivK
MKKRVLLVENDAASRELLSDWLTREGYEAVSADDVTHGKAALVLLTPDAVLLDIGLGEHNGLDLAAWMRQQSRLAGVPVIAVTAHAMTSDREFILKSGCNDYVPKPVDFARLRQCLERWMSAPQVTRTRVCSAIEGE